MPVKEHCPAPGVTHGDLAPDDHRGIGFPAQSAAQQAVGTPSAHSPSPHLDECLQQVVDSDPAKGALLVPCEDLSSAEVHRVLANGLLNLIEDLLGLGAVLVPAQGRR